MDNLLITELKIKMFDGKSLLDLLESKECKQDHLDRWYAETTAMREARDRSGIANSRAPSTNDFMSCESIPGGIEHED